MMNSIFPDVVPCVADGDVKGIDICTQIGLVLCALQLPRKTSVVETMFSAFDAADVNGVVETVSEDTVWIYHGTQIIPKGSFEGREGVRTFFTNILERTDILSFAPEQFVVEGNMVVVLGQEHQRSKRSGKEMKQKWVQIYTVESGLISRMEEFATSEEVP